MDARREGDVECARLERRDDALGDIATAQGDNGLDERQRLAPDQCHLGRHRRLVDDDASGIGDAALRENDAAQVVGEGRKIL